MDGIDIKVWVLYFGLWIEGILDSLMFLINNNILSKILIKEIK